MAKRYLLRKDGVIQQYNIKHLNKQYKKTGLKKNNKIVWKKKKEKLAWKVKTQTTWHTKGTVKKGTLKGKKYKTTVFYTAHGLFDNKPQPNKIEQMIGNSLVKAWKKKIPRKLYNNLVWRGIRGIETRKVKTTKEIDNQLKIEFEIKKGKKKWKGKNS